MALRADRSKVRTFGSAGSPIDFVIHLGGEAAAFVAATALAEDISLGCIPTDRHRRPVVTPRHWFPSEGKTLLPLSRGAAPAAPTVFRRKEGNRYLPGAADRRLT